MGVFKKRGCLAIGLILLAVIRLTGRLSPHIFEDFIVKSSISLKDGVPSVSYIGSRRDGAYPRNWGSIEGGTLLWIRGTGFAPNRFDLFSSVSSTNTVYLVRNYSIYECIVRDEETTETQLACYTLPMPEGSYHVRIYVNDYLIPFSSYLNGINGTFYASLNNTPVISTISPVTGLPQRLVTLTGDFKANCYTTDVVGCNLDNVTRISR